MKFMAFVGTEGAMAPESVEEMNRDWPAYEEVLAKREGLRLGRELRVRDEGVCTVRMRDGEALISDGPFAETKEYVAGIDIFEASGWDDAIELESLSPVARFLPFEIRPLPERFQLGMGVAAFRDRDDSAGLPYLLIVWADPDTRGDSADTGADADCKDWRERVEAMGAFVLGGSLSQPSEAKTLRLPARDQPITDGPFIRTPAFISGIEVIRSPSLPAAAELAATHPQARIHALEVRPFYSQAA